MPFLTIDGNTIPVAVESWKEEVQRFEDQARTYSGALRVARLGNDKRSFAFRTISVDYATGNGYITLCNNKSVVISGDAVNGASITCWARAWREVRIMQGNGSGGMLNNAGPIFVELVEV